MLDPKKTEGRLETLTLEAVKVWTVRETMPRKGIDAEVLTALHILIAETRALRCQLDDYHMERGDVGAKK